MSRTLPLTAIALMFGLGFQATAQEAVPPTPSRPGLEQRQQRLATRLRLTEAQKASFKAVQAKHQDALAAKRKAAMTAHDAFAQAMQKPESKPEELKALHQAYSSLAFDLALERRALGQECRALLTPEQLEQRARMEGRREGMKAGWRHGAGFRGHGEGMGLGND